MTSTPANATALLLVGDVGGITVIDPSTPLRRLNYFDGKFLRADDFKVEQDYLRNLVGLSNQGLGAGLVYGYDTTLGSGDTLQIGPGLAVDPSGKVLLLQRAVTQSVQALIDATRKLAARPPDASGKTGGFSDCVEVAAPPPTTVLQSSDIYVIAICAAEALCGQQDVFGIACQDPCVATSDRPYRLDGVVLRAIPLQLVTPFPTSKAVAIDADKYLRSKVAHSWFADEVAKHPGAISRAGLLSQVWCVGAGYDSSCCEVPLAVVARSGATTLFLDAWTVRRERIDAPAKRYWQWKMRMRPWDVYLGQILQFQCQLADALAGIVVPGSRVPGATLAAHRALDDAAQFVAQVRSGLASYRSLAANATLTDRPALLSLSMTQVSDLQERLSAVLQTGLAPAVPTQRVLISLGLIETSSAGYLPVVTGSDLSVNQQVRALLGDGLNLRFCIVTADYIAHAIEEAQHMDRISLLQGLDDPAKQPHVDILVPDGKALVTATSPGAGLYDMALNFSAQQTGGLVYKGAARETLLAGGGTALYSAGAGLSQATIPKMQVLARAIANPTATTKPTTVTANLYSNNFIKKAAGLGVKLDVKVADAATQARSFVNAGVIASHGGATGLEAAARASSANETVDGLWINARVDNHVRTLGVGGHTAVNLRVVLGTRPATPQAIELAFGGTLAVTSASTVSGSLQLGGTLNGVLSIGLVHEDQAKQSTAEYLMTERFNWPAKLGYLGDSSSGSVTLDLDLGSKAGMLLRIVKTIAGNGVQISYQFAVVVPNAAGLPSSVVQLGQLVLAADPGVADPVNPYHQYAINGLDLVQAALIVSEPALKTQAESLLFPVLSAATPELVIQAVRDWVAFTRRRERQCTVDVLPPKPLPPRRYRVIEETFDSAEQANLFITEFEQRMKSPVTLAQALQALLARSQKREEIHLVLRYGGGSAVAQSDLVAAEADWKTFGPGGEIRYALIGAVGESDAALQIGRLATFKTAIAADSKERKGAVEDVLIPYPEAGLPDDADGIMLLVTVRSAAVIVKNDMLIVAVPSAAATAPYFLTGSPHPTVTFQNEVPQGTALASYIGNLAPDSTMKFSSVTLWSTTSAIDAGAEARVLAVRDALFKAGRVGATAPTSTKVLTGPLRAELANIPLTGTDDVIAVEGEVQIT